MFFGSERGHQLSTYATVVEMGRGDHPKCGQLRTGVGGVTPYVHVLTYTISFHVSGSIFVLQYLVLFVEI